MKISAEFEVVLHEIMVQNFNKLSKSLRLFIYELVRNKQQFFC